MPESGLFPFRALSSSARLTSAHRASYLKQRWGEGGGRGNAGSKSSDLPVTRSTDRYFPRFPSISHPTIDRIHPRFRIGESAFLSRDHDATTCPIQCRIRQIIKSACAFPVSGDGERLVVPTALPTGWLAAVVFPVSRDPIAPEANSIPAEKAGRKLKDPGSVVRPVGRSVRLFSSRQNRQREGERRGRRGREGVVELGGGEGRGERKGVFSPRPGILHSLRLPQTRASIWASASRHPLPSRRLSLASAPPPFCSSFVLSLSLYTPLRTS